jgi:hypothetical protein
MNKLSLVVVAAGLACVATSCAERVAPTAKAASVEQLQCDRGAVSGDDVRLLQATTVLAAHPLYSHVISGKNDSEDRVIGARLTVRPPEGVSSERLTRVIQCHSARALLGQVDPAAFANDPYWLPDAWLDIQVVPENGNYEVVLRADNIPDGLQVLHRATAFAGTHRANEATP